MTNDDLSKRFGQITVSEKTLYLIIAVLEKEINYMVRLNRPDDEDLQEHLQQYQRALKQANEAATFTEFTYIP